MSTREVCLGVIDGRQEGEKLELVVREHESGTVEMELLRALRLAQGLTQWGLGERGGATSTTSASRAGGPT